MDFEEEAKDHVKERMRNPFWGYFVSIFVIYNWKILFVIFFSDLSAFEKVELWDDSYHYSRLLAPSLYAVAAVILSPFFTALILILSHKGRRFLTNHELIDDANVHINREMNNMLKAARKSFEDTQKSGEYRESNPPE